MANELESDCQPPVPPDHGEVEPVAFGEAEDDYFADGNDSMLRRSPICMFTIPLQLTIAIFEMLCPHPKPEKFEGSDNDRKQ